MTGSEFLRRLKSLGKRHGIPVRFNPERGKGSHGTVYYGSRFAILRNKSDELKSGTLHGMLEQLGLSLADLMEG